MTPGPTQSLDLRATDDTLFSAFLLAKKRYGGNRAALTDGDERTLSYNDLGRAALALGNALRRQSRTRENVGVLLPNGVGAVIAVLALSAYGRVPAMLNFTAGHSSMAAALDAAAITRVVTAHQFIELGKFQELERFLSSRAEMIYLEDVRENLGVLDKAAALLGPLMPSALNGGTRPHDPAVILFTSGTEGDPKGVVLSHANVLANVEQVRAHIELFPEDVVFSPLPTFHSLGLTVGALMPLYVGIRAVLHPTPRQPHEIVRRIHKHKATILLATDTFFSQYVRVANDDEMASLRIAVFGAERLRDETRHLVHGKLKAELVEGYGVTEAAPVISANQCGANRHGTVGRLLPGIEARIEPIEGINTGGRLYVRGPNIMLGYLRPSNPGTIEPLPDGWHDTGDVVSMDDDGFLSIRGRLKRFAKIGGETVSLTVVENCASAVWPDHMHAAIAVPDGRKGEQIVLVTTCPEANRPELIAWVQNHGVTELAVPRRFIHVADIPILGTGKTDYVSVKRMVESAGAG